MPELGNSLIFSQVDANNNSGTMPSWSGSAAPSTLDDAGRAFQGAVTREWNWRNFTLSAGGSADTKTLTYSTAPAAYYNGQRFAFLANTTNTGSATLNVNSLGAKTIKKDVSGTLTNLSASDMVSGMFIEVAYNTANDCFVWANRGGVSTGNANTFTASQTIEVTDNTNPALRVTQLGSAPALRVEDSANPDSSPFIVDASGNVGIGTTTVNGLVNINGTTPLISLYNSGTYNADIGLGVFTGFGDTLGMNARGAGGVLTFGTNNTERLRITSAGGVSFGSSGTAYGTSGQVLISQGNAPPVWGSAGGATLLGTITTTSGTSQALGSLVLTGYKFLRLVFNGVSHNGGTTQTISVNTVACTPSVSAAAVLYGFVEIDLSTSTASSTVASASNAIGGALTTVTTATTTITVAPSSGSFDAGSITVYGIV